MGYASVLSQNVLEGYTVVCRRSQVSLELLSNLEVEIIENRVTVGHFHLTQILADRRSRIQF